MSIFIFVLLVLLLNLWIQRRSSTLLSAFKRSIGAGIVIVLVFQVLAYFYSGFIDPFIIIAVSIQLVVAVLVGFVVGAGYIKFSEVRSRGHLK